eukprot:15364675-Ditylum_brightwellii.AAC.1
MVAAPSVHLLNYAVMHPDAILRYHASGMVLHIHLDASFMSETRACSRVGGHYFLRNPTADPANMTEDEVHLNRLVHSIYKIIQNNMSSTAETEVGALYINTWKVEELHIALNEMKNPVAYATVFNLPSGLQGCVESSWTLTTWTQDWNPITNVDGINNSDITGRQTGSVSPIMSKSKLLVDYSYVVNLQS